jgi:hypothetical protein
MERNDLINDKDSSKMSLIYAIDVVKSKVPIKEEYIPMPTFSFSY